MKFNLFSILILTGVLISCGKSTEVTIVNDSSGILPGDSDQTTRSETIFQDDFSVLKIGEANPIKTLDPLFATTSSEYRVHTLIYDGLTKITEKNSVEPSIAKKWTVSRDSLRYTFTIRENVFYHNNSRFPSGIGRQVTPKDVVSNFERMASILVPDNAADMFSHIRGFNAYHSEQTYIKIPSNRTIKSIEGISVTNDSTLVFLLSKKDPEFLRKLAHPLASVYPKESLPADKSPIYEAIGTGGYYLAQRKNNVLILASNDDYYQEQNVPTRLDITHGKKESEIYQDFAKGELDVLIEPGPGTILQVTDPEGSIDPIFESVFAVDQAQVKNTITFYYNPASNNQSIFSYLVSQSNSFLNFENSLGEFKTNSNQTFSDSLEKTTVHIAYTDNPTDLYLISAIAEKLTSVGVNSVMNSSYAVTEDVSFSTIYFPSSKPAIVWEFPVYILTKPGISGITFSQEPWNISFENVIINKNN